MTAHQEVAGVAIAGERRWWVVAGLAAAAGWGLARLLLADRFPQAMDAFFHLRFAEDYATALGQGEWLPDWDARPYGGLGTPAFRYYAPLAYWLTAAGWALGLEITTALKLTVTLFALIGAAGAWRWLADHDDRLPAPLAAMAVLASPLLPMQVFLIFNFQNLCGVLLLPWVLWAWERAVPRPPIPGAIPDPGQGPGGAPPTHRSPAPDRASSQDRNQILSPVSSQDQVHQRRQSQNPYVTPPPVPDHPIDPAPKAESTDRPGDPRALILMLAVLGWTHLPTTLLAGYVLLALATIEAVRRRSMVPLARLAASALWAGALIAPYALPAMLTRSDVHFDTLEELLPWRRADFFDDALDPDRSAWAAIHRVWLLWLGLIALATLVGLIARRQRGLTSWSPSIAVAGGLGAMLFRPSIPLWQWLPGFRVLQYPYRLVAPIFILSLPVLLAPWRQAEKGLAAAGIPTDSAPANPPGKRGGDGDDGNGTGSGPRLRPPAASGPVRLLSAGVWLLMFALGGVIQGHGKVVSSTDLDEYRQVSPRYPHEYGPIACPAPRDRSPRAGPVRVFQVACGSARLQTGWHRFAASEIEAVVDQATATIEIATHADPGWRLTVDAIPTAWETAPPCGTMRFVLGQGRHRIRLERRWPCGRALGLVCAAGGFLLLLARRPSSADAPTPPLPPQPGCG